MINFRYFYTFLYTFVMRRQVEIARCEEFQSHAYNTLKKTLYNEGKKLKKIIKLK